jgi:hypothetical protein
MLSRTVGVLSIFLLTILWQKVSDQDLKLAEYMLALEHRMTKVESKLDHAD